MVPSEKYPPEATVGGLPSAGKNEGGSVVKKRFILMVLVIVLPVILCSCIRLPIPGAASTPAPSRSTRPSASSQAGSTGSTSSAPTPAPAESAFVGTYYDASGVAPPEYTPAISFAADGSFHFAVNLLEGMGEITGSYAEGAGVIECAVSSINFSGFAGEGISAFSLTVVDANTLVYNGEMVGATSAGATFVRTAPPAQAAEVMAPEHKRFQEEGKPPYIVDADGGLNMRAGPGTEYESILLIPDGELLTPIGGMESASDWEYVRYNGTEGWVNRQYAPLYGV